MYLEHAGHQGNDQYAETKKKDVAVRHESRHQEMPAPNRNTMRENHRHRVFQNGEGQGTEEQHGDQKQPSDDIAMGHEIAELADDGAGLAGQQPFEIASQRFQQILLVNQVGQDDNNQNQQRHQRKQRVIGNRARQQQPLIGAKRLERLQGEGAGMGKNILRLMRNDIHAGLQRMSERFKAHP
jgi:hypothetical protein